MVRDSNGAWRWGFYAGQSRGEPIIFVLRFVHLSLTRVSLEHGCLEGSL